MSKYVSLSVDLDNHWSYLKTHGNPAWEAFPTYLDRVVPLICELADAFEVTLTVFAVGRDAEMDVNSNAFSILGESRHEIANHSFHHEPWLHLKSPDEIEEEVVRAGEAIEAATGKSPTGFRGPGFSVSSATIDSLRRNGYRYDASTLPTFIGPLARAFYMRQSKLDKDELERRGALFGGFREVFRPVKPYAWETGGGDGLLEIPVTTMPLFRVPIHVTYLTYLAGFSPGLSNAYLKWALAMCSLTGVKPSMLLHSLDFIGSEDIDDLGFFPGMEMTGAHKRRLLQGWVEILAGWGRIVTMAEHADIAGSSPLRGQSAASLA